MRERDELTDQVVQTMYRYVSQNNTDGTTEGYIRITGEFATEIIAAVRADERRAIRAALLSGEVVDKAAFHTLGIGNHWMDRTHKAESFVLAEMIITAALAAIGLDESEGQG